MQLEEFLLNISQTISFLCSKPSKTSLSLGIKTTVLTVTFKGLHNLPSLNASLVLSPWSLHFGHSGPSMLWDIQSIILFLGFHPAYSFSLKFSFLKPVILNHCCPPKDLCQNRETILIVISGERMLLASGGESFQLLLNILRCTEQPSSTKSCPFPEINRAQTDKYCLRGSHSSLPPCLRDSICPSHRKQETSQLISPCLQNILIFSIQ